MGCSFDDWRFNFADFDGRRGNFLGLLKVDGYQEEISSISLFLSMQLIIYILKLELLLDGKSIVISV